MLSLDVLFECSCHCKPKRAMDCASSVYHLQNRSLFRSDMIAYYRDIYLAWHAGTVTVKRQDLQVKPHNILIEPAHTRMGLEELQHSDNSSRNTKGSRRTIVQQLKMWQAEKPEELRAMFIDTFARLVPEASRASTVVQNKGSDSGLDAQETVVSETSPAEVPPTPPSPRPGGARGRRARPRGRIVVDPRRGKKGSSVDAGATGPRTPTVDNSSVDTAPPPPQMQRLGYDILCKEGVAQLFPDATQLELLEFWSLVDPSNRGAVAVDEIIRALDEGDELTESDVVDITRSFKFMRKSPDLPTCTYERPSSLLASSPLPYATMRATGALSGTTTGGSPGLPRIPQ